MVDDDFDREPEARGPKAICVLRLYSADSSSSAAEAG